MSIINMAINKSLKRQKTELLLVAKAKFDLGLLTPNLYRIMQEKIKIVRTNKLKLLTDNLTNLVTKQRAFKYFITYHPRADEYKFQTIDKKEIDGKKYTMAYTQCDNLYKRIGFTKNVEVVIYGEYVEKRTQSPHKLIFKSNGMVDINATKNQPPQFVLELVYVPDFTYTKIFGRALIETNRITKGKSGYKNNFKGAVYSKISEIFRRSSPPEPMAGRLIPIQRVEPVFVQQNLKDAIKSNCLINCIRKALENNQKVLHNLTPHLDNIEKKYLDIGIPLTKSGDELREIIKPLYGVSLTIFDKLDNVIFSSKITNDKTLEVKTTLSKLNHVVDYIKVSKSLSSLEIKYTNNIDLDFKNAEGTVFFKKNDKFDLCKNIIKYYWDDKYIYKPAFTKTFDNGKYYIHSIEDVSNDEFNSMNNITEMLVKNDDPTLYDFINNSVHHLSEIFFPITPYPARPEETDEPIISNLDLDDGFREETLNLSDLYCYDKNKAYASYEHNNYYKSNLFPSSSKFNFYKVVDMMDEVALKQLLTKAGFCQIKDISRLPKTVEMLNIFKDGYVYAMPLINWLFNNNVKFTIMTIAFNIWKQDIKFTDKMVSLKHFHKIVGSMAITSEKSRLSVKCSDIKEAELLRYTSNEIIYNYDDKLKAVDIEMDKLYIANKSYLSSYFLSYAIINVLEKVIHIEPKDLRGIRVDCIMVSKDYSHLFNLNNDVSGWKVENKTGLITIRRTYDYINCKTNKYTDIENILTDKKLNLNKINMVTGMAGSGKTTLFLSTKHNEKLYNTLATFPNNELCMKFKNEMKSDMMNINTSTYHKAFNIGCYNEHPTKYNNILIDEATMIGLTDIEKIVEYASQHHIILLLVGDYDYKTKKIYQMPPVKDVSFLNYKFNKQDINIIENKKNYRQNKDIDFSTFLNNMRGKTNDYILKCINMNYEMFAQATPQYMYNNYNVSTDIILCPNKHKGITEATTIHINQKMFDISKQTKDKVVCAKYLKTNNLHARNENIKTTVDEFNDKTMFLSYAITSHLCQGCEYNEESKIYIMNTNYYEDNMLYVLLSRAKIASQIILINFE